MEHQNATPPRQQTPSDEIDLFELWDILVKKKWLIFAVTSLFAIGSVAVAYSIKPVYQASAHFLPPLKKEAEALNFEFVGTDYSQEDLYAEFQRNFSSQSNLWAFFSEKELYKTYLEGEYDSLDINSAFEREFVKRLSLKVPKAQKGELDAVSATFDWENRKLVAELLNEYVQQVMEKTSAQLVGDVNAAVSNKKTRLLEEVSALRKSAEKDVGRKIVRLEEAIFIARKLGIKRSVDSGGAADKSSVFVDASGKRPDYYLGYEALEAELEAIRNRKSVDPFIPGLDEKLSQIDRLDALEIPEKVSVVRVSRKAEPPRKPIKPNKILIVAVGVVVGFMGSIMFVLLRNASVSRQGRSSTVPMGI